MDPMLNRATDDEVGAVRGDGGLREGGVDAAVQQPGRDPGAVGSPLVGQEAAVRAVGRRTRRSGRSSRSTRRRAPSRPASRSACRCSAGARRRRAGAAVDRRPKTSVPVRAEFRPSRHATKNWLPLPHRRLPAGMRCAVPVATAIGPPMSLPSAPTRWPRMSPLLALIRSSQTTNHSPAPRHIGVDLVLRALDDGERRRRGRRVRRQERGDDVALRALVRLPDGEGPGAVPREAGVPAAVVGGQGHPAGEGGRAALAGPASATGPRGRRRSAAIACGRRGVHGAPTSGPGRARGPRRSGVGGGLILPGEGVGLRRAAPLRQRG